MDSNTVAAILGSMNEDQVNLLDRCLNYATYRELNNSNLMKQGSRAVSSRKSSSQSDNSSKGIQQSNEILMRNQETILQLKT